MTIIPANPRVNNAKYSAPSLRHRYIAMIDAYEYVELAAIERAKRQFIIFDDADDDNDIDAGARIWD